jgi:hypothetical protein
MSRLIWRAGPNIRHNVRNDTYNSANIIHGSEREGWCLGYVGLPWPGPWPKRSGDLFVVDPDGWQAGIAWQADGPEIEAVAGPSEGRWGVFQLRFPLPVMSEADLIRNFHHILPLLIRKRAELASDAA